MSPGRKRIDEIIIFPHLYRCGHIEAGFTRTSVVFAPSHFRIFIDAATLKVQKFDSSYSASRDFRIFIDAATLKVHDVIARIPTVHKFPHLYRCGHIEAQWSDLPAPRNCRYFRIFIDAATLKRARGALEIPAFREISASL